MTPEVDTFARTHHAATHLLALAAAGHQVDELALEWARFIVRANPTTKRVAPAQGRIAQAFEEDVPWNGLSFVELRERTRLSASSLSSGLSEMHQAKPPRMFVVPVWRASRYFLTEPGAAVRDKILLEHALQKSTRERELTESKRLARKAKKEAKPPRPAPAPKPPKPPKAAKPVLDRRIWPEARNDPPPKARKKNRPGPALVIKAKPLGSKPIFSSGEAFTPAHVKVQVCPSPPDRFAVTGPVIGGFLSEWHSKRGGKK